MGRLIRWWRGGALLALKIQRSVHRDKQNGNNALVREGKAAMMPQIIIIIRVTGSGP